MHNYMYMHVCSECMHIMILIAGCYDWLPYELCARLGTQGRLAGHACSMRHLVTEETTKLRRARQVHGMARARERLQGAW
jgi:hypothetical protein